MATKTITITEEAYRRLRQSKSGEESFSEIITRITGNAGQLLKFAGMLTEKDAEKLEARIKENRKRWLRIEVEKKAQLRGQLHGVS